MRNLRPLATAVAVLTLLAGAASATGAATPPGAGTAQSSAPRLPTTSADAIAGAKAVRAEAESLLGPVIAHAGGRGGNVVFSPASLAVAVAMLRAGTQGASASQIDGLFATSGPRLLQGMNALDQHLTALSGPGTNVQGHKGDVTLWSANRLFGQTGVTWQSAFLATLASRFGADLLTVDYAHDPDGARRIINRWVSDQTRGKIPALIPAGAITAQNVLTLVNALYLKAPWFAPFDATSPKAPFRRFDGKTVSAPTMHLGGSIAHLRGAGWTAVRLSYAGQKLAMTVIVPDAGHFADVRTALGGRLLGTVLTSRYTTGPGQLWLPRFKIRTKVPLNSVLGSRGLTRIFQPTHDLDPMSAQLAGTLAVGQIRQEATITVDEQGTEAAAATSVEIIVTSAPGNPFLLRVDHPFLFVVHDVATGTPLFIGQVGDPTAG